MQARLPQPCARSAIADAIALLTPVERLAVAYAPAPARTIWLGLLALDRRLADAARDGREPIMVQLRLAWWRDRFAEPATQWPTGEPLLALLRAWDTERAALQALVDGWEARSVGEDDGVQLTDARIDAMDAVARLCALDPDPAIRRAAEEWLGVVPPGRAPRLPLAMRPLVILRGLAVRDSERLGPLRRLGLAVRLGLSGR